MSVSKDSLLNFFETDLGIDITDIVSSTLVFSSGIIDSFALVSLLMFIEKEENIRINPGDVTLQNMDSIDRILSYAIRVKEIV